jgi:hypothetical protein
MSDTIALPDVMPSAASSEAEIAAWQTLPRDEQLRRLRLVLSHPDCDRVSDATIDDIRVKGQALAARSRDGQV